MQHTTPTNSSGLFGLLLKSKKAAIILAVLIAELLALSLLYNHNFVFECRAALPAVFCASLSLGVMRVIGVLGVLVLFFSIRRDVGAWFLKSIPAEVDWKTLVVQVFGFLLVLAPLLFLADGASQGSVSFAVVCWLLGLVISGLSTLRLVTPFAHWFDLAKRSGWSLWIPITFAIVLPEIGAAAQFVWYSFDFVTDLTFNAVAWVFYFLGYPFYVEAEDKFFALQDFAVLIGKQCSGVEGFLLISIFLGYFIWLFRHGLRFPRVLWLFPIGILLSWILNVVRISGLLLIGQHISPDLAINGFHSHAGWLMFTLLSVGVALLAYRIPFFRKPFSEPKAVKERTPAQPFFKDPMVANIVPFMIMMAALLLSQTFMQLPALSYPIRFAFMAGGLLIFLSVYRRYEWRFDILSAAVGAVIGIAWIATASTEASGDDALNLALMEQGTLFFVIWVLSRTLGTILLVPIIEELFFRGYIFDQADFQKSITRVVIALAISTAFFAFLHDRWIIAGLAGLAFGLLRLRSNNISDPIVSHMVANAVVAAAAVYAGSWSLI